MHLISREEIIIYAISQFFEKGFIATDREIQSLSKSLGINIPTLFNYLCRSISSGNLNTSHSKVRGKKVKIYLMAEKGLEALGGINEKINGFWLESDLYDLPSDSRLGSILSMIDRPYGRILLVNMIDKGMEPNIPIFLKAFRTDHYESSIYPIMKEIDSKRIQGSGIDLINSFLDMSIFGGFSEDLIRGPEWSSLTVDAMMVLTDIYMKRGKLSEAAIINDRVLSNEGLSQNQWVIASLRKIEIGRHKGNPDESLSLLLELKRFLKTKVQKSLVDLSISKILSETGEYSDAEKLLRSLVGRFRMMGFSFLLAIAEVHLAILYFRVNKIEMADTVLRCANRNVLQSGNEYLKAFVMVNLADVHILRGNLEKARLFLDRSELIFGKYMDLEGIAGVEFNRALFYAAARDSDMAIEHFKRSEVVAHPLPCITERLERRKVFTERMSDNGLEVDSKVFIHPPRRL